MQLGDHSARVCEQDTIIILFFRYASLLGHLPPFLFDYLFCNLDVTIVLEKSAYIVLVLFDGLSSFIFNQHLGLSVTESSKLHNYFHFREPVRLTEKSLLEKADLDKSIDFLDPVHEDIPRGTCNTASKTFMKSRDRKTSIFTELLTII